MLWHRQAIFESKEDKLSSSAQGRIRTHQGLRHQIASRLNAHWQTDWAIEGQAKNLNSTARPYDQRAFSPLDPTAVWHSHLARAIYMLHTYIDTYSVCVCVCVCVSVCVFVCVGGGTNLEPPKHDRYQSKLSINIVYIPALWMSRCELPGRSWWQIPHISVLFIIHREESYQRNPEGLPMRFHSSLGILWILCRLLPGTLYWPCGFNGKIAHWLAKGPIFQDIL